MVGKVEGNEAKKGNVGWRGECRRMDEEGRD